MNIGEICNEKIEKSGLIFLFVLMLFSPSQNIVKANILSEDTLLSYDEYDDAEIVFKNIKNSSASSFKVERAWIPSAKVGPSLLIQANLYHTGLRCSSSNSNLLKVRNLSSTSIVASDRFYSYGYDYTYEIALYPSKTAYGLVNLSIQKYDGLHITSLPVFVAYDTLYGIADSLYILNSTNRQVDITEEIVLETGFIPEGTATDVKWTSTNPSVAVVVKEDYNRCRIVPISVGETRIIAYDDNGLADTMWITVTQQETPLVITKQPVGVVVAEGETANVTVEASGNNLKYEWYYCNAGETTFQKAAAFTGSTYSVKMNSTYNGRKLYCKITDGNGKSEITNVVEIKMVEPLIATIAEISSNSISIDIHAASTTSVSGQFVVAVYDNNGKMLAVKVFEAKEHLIVQMESVGTSAKVFWVDSIKSAFPLCVPVKLST